MSEIPWWSPEGLELDGEVIEEWCHLTDDMASRWAGKDGRRRILAFADFDGDDPELPYEWGADPLPYVYQAEDCVLRCAVTGRAPTIEAAKEAADRALLARVFRARGIPAPGRHRPDSGLWCKVGNRSWTVGQSREILEGAAGANPVSCPGCGAPEHGAHHVACPVLAENFDAQLADLVTGLPLDGGVIGAPDALGWRPTWAGVASRLHVNNGRYGFMRSCCGCFESADSAADADRELLRASLEEARARPGGLRVSGRFLIWERTGATGRLARKIALVRAVLPDFDWAGVPGYEPEPADREDESLIDMARRSLRELGIEQPTYKGPLLDEVKRTLAEQEPVRCICGDQHAEVDCPTVKRWAEWQPQPELWTRHLHPSEVVAIIQAGGDGLPRHHVQLAIELANDIAEELAPLPDTPAHHRLEVARWFVLHPEHRRILASAAWRFRHVVREAWGSGDE